jgi:chromosome segregation ATPase
MASFTREDDVQRERTNSAFEMLRRIEAELENLRGETNRISRLDDRLELVQAERTRHNERLNEIAAELTKVDTRLNDHSERTALIEVRMANHQEELRHIRERLHMDRETISAYLHSISELEADLRKRQIIALEKEIRDVRGRALDFTED